MNENKTSMHENYIFMHKMIFSYTEMIFPCVKIRKLFPKFCMEFSSMNILRGKNLFHGWKYHAYHDMHENVISCMKLSCMEFSCVKCPRMEFPCIKEYCHVSLHARNISYGWYHKETYLNSCQPQNNKSSMRKVEETPCHSMLQPQN